MIYSITVYQTREMLCQVCDRVISERDRLTLLDGPIGDGDHGIGMSRGMMAAKQALTVYASEHGNEYYIKDLFYRMGRAMISTMGGSSGVIFGTMFMGAAAGVDKVTEIDCQVFTGMMGSSLQAVKKKGKAVPGEKTMVDALEPAVLSMEDLDTDDLVLLLDQAARAAAQGAEASKDMISRHGHSKTLGERALGHPDPGAVSVAIIFRAMAEYLVSL